VEKPSGKGNQGGSFEERLKAFVRAIKPLFVLGFNDVIFLTS
jgi:hypothetical protein